MPNYEFKCEKCGHVYSEIRSIEDRKLPGKCPKCKSPTKQIVADYHFTVNIK